MRRPDDQRSRERRSCVRRECARLRGRPQLAWLARPSLAIDVWSGGNTPPLRVAFLCDATGCRIIAQIGWELKEGWWACGAALCASVCGRAWLFAGVHACLWA